MIYALLLTGYLIFCIFGAIILLVTYKFVIKSHEIPSFWTLYKICFSSGLIQAFIGYILFRLSIAAVIFGFTAGQDATMVMVSIMSQILSHPRTIAALYLIAITLISSLITYAGLYLAHRYHAKSTPKQVASKVSLIIAVFLLIILGASFAYNLIAMSNAMAEMGAANPQISADQAAAMKAAANCSEKMQKALALPPADQAAAMQDASNCMIEAGKANPSLAANQAPAINSANNTSLPEAATPTEPVGQAFAPSFDCAKATSNVNKLICSDQQLSALDVQLSQIYKQALGSAAEPNSLKLDQRVWLKNTLNTCNDKQCILAAYQGRIENLQSVH
jgi:uncharacterized protein YecT (DUF1311 family)